MIQNYWKVAVRYLMRYKEYTLINVLGLAVGVCCCMLIMMFVRSEMSYDRFHKNANRLYRVWQHEKYQGEDFINVVTPLPMAGALQSSFPEIELACKVNALNALVQNKEKAFNENIRMVDPSFFSMFDFKVISGNKNALSSESSIVLTPEAEKKYFGNSGGLGKTLNIKLGDQPKTFVVTAIAEPAPVESSIQYNMLISSANEKELYSGGRRKSWYNVSDETYVLLQENASAEALEKKFPAMMKQQLGKNYKEGNFILHLQPITSIHLDPTLPEGFEPISNPKYSYILSTIGALILLLACINFITLSIGRSTTRALEVGVRKALGAERKQLIRQFWGEAMLLTFMSVILGIGLAILFSKPFAGLLGHTMELHLDFLFFLFTIVLIFIIAFIAGIYPAIILSGFNAIEVLKGKLKTGNRMGIFRHSLIVAQFIISIVMIVSTIVIAGQLNYLKSKDLGYDKEQVVIVPTNKGRKEGADFARLYRNELKKYPEVAASGVSIFSFSEYIWAGLGYTDDKKVYRSFKFNAVDPSFVDAMKIGIIQGRNFSEGNTDDKNNNVLVNEAFVKEFGIEEPIGKKLPGPYNQRIIGVMKDFNFESLHSKIDPLVLAINPDSMLRSSENVSFNYAPQPRISVRMKAGDVKANLGILRSAWQAVAPGQDFEYHFLDEALAKQYEREEKTTTVVQIASALSIFIACIGLFGLATLIVTRRTKEIGIRKTLGAGIGNIVVLLSRDFVLLVFIASLLSFPLAWWALNKWLEDFAYHIDITIWPFIISATLALLISLLTVSFQTIKAAIANPVKSLRTE